MPMPEDLFQDEIEHPEQTRQLQQNYLLAQADQDSLRKIRTRLSALHSPSLSSPSVEEMPTSPLSIVSNETLEHRRAGQFLPPRFSPPLKPKKKVLNQWSFVALVALLCVVVLSGVWYGLNHVIGSTSHYILPQVTPTGAPHQKSTPFPSHGLKMTSATIHTTLQGDGQSNAVIAILDMKFFTSQHGILSIVSRKNAQEPYSFYLYETNNGGDSWIPLGTRIETQSLHLEILDPTHLLLTGGQTITVYVLINDQWQSLHNVQISGNIGMTSFVSSQLGWLLSDKRVGNQGIMTMYKTSDGGLSWDTVKQVSILISPQQQGG